MNIVPSGSEAHLSYVGSLDRRAPDQSLGSSLVFRTNLQFNSRGSHILALSTENNLFQFMTIDGLNKFLFDLARP